MENTGNANNIYWSVENNAIGEAALIVINDFGEENIPGLFISEPMREKVMCVNLEKDLILHTQQRLVLVLRMKQWLKKQSTTFKQQSLITELKNFVATGTSYKAKVGQTDDLTMLRCYQ